MKRIAAAVLISLLCISVLKAQTGNFDAFYRELAGEIQTAIPARELKRFPVEFHERNFLDTDFGKIRYFKYRKKRLNSILEMQQRNREKLRLLQSKPQPQPAVKPEEKESAVKLNPFRWQWPTISAKAGMDYFKVDPGLLMPESDRVQIKTYPFYYYDCKLGLRFDFIGADVRVKNSLLDNKFKGNNINQEYKNREDMTSKEEKAKTREKVINYIGYLTPLRIKIGTQYKVGIYVNGEYRVFQTEVKVKEPTVFQDKTKSITLLPEEKNLINMFQEAYTGGIVFSKEYYKIAFGYRHLRLDAPHYIEADKRIWTITSKSHAGYVYLESKRRSWKLSGEGTYGMTKFTKPDGDTVRFIYAYEGTGVNKTPKDTEKFYRSQSRNSYGLTFFNHLTIGAYLGYSGLLPIYSDTVPSIGLSLAAQAFSYGYSMYYNGIPLQAPMDILFSYYFFKKQNNDVFYGEISAGLQAGIKF